MNDDQRKLLTEYIGECWHELFPYSNDKGMTYCIKCGKEFCVTMIYNHTRTFTTEADMMALYRRLAEQDLWPLFEIYYWDKNSSPHKDGEFTKWLFCLSGEGYEERCQMVADFLRR